MFRRKNTKNKNKKNLTEGMKCILKMLRFVMSDAV